MKKTLLLFLLIPFIAFSQTDDEKMIKAIFNESLENGESYEMLRYLSKKIGHRLSGSPQAAAAVEWTRQQMIQLDFDEVFLQEVMVPHWQRGEVETASIINSENYGTVDLSVCSIGNSVGTSDSGVTAGVIAVNELSELKSLGREKIEGKIVFFNRPFDQSLINTFAAYGAAVDQRASGPSEAARFGAVGAIIRSMASSTDDIPHTGTLRYADDAPKIPALAVSTLDANRLEKILKMEPELKLHIESSAKMLPDVLSHNVIGEIKGKGKKYIIVGGHLDSWDKGEGAHDDGGGCIQSIEALRILKAVGYKPKNNLRAVMFMNEENGLRGGLKYAELAAENKEKHLAAIESDRGVFTPRGFTSTLPENQKQKLTRWEDLFAPYGFTDLESNGGGADISPLAEQGAVLFGLLPDSQRYFTLHHTEADVFETVNQRELELGAAGLAALIYLIDKYELK